MRYKTRQNIDALRPKYDHIVAYGVGWTIRWDYAWQEVGYEALIDGWGKRIGEKLGATEIRDSRFLASLSGKTLVVIYSVFEAEILEAIRQMEAEGVDTICYKLLDVPAPGNRNLPFPVVYAKNGEDMLVLNQLGKLGIRTPRVLEIGVCHPIVRNNTYLLNQLYSKEEGYEGVLVEANPLCWPLIEDYRESDTLVRGGVDSRAGEELFYIFPIAPGLSTFDREEAQRLIDRGFEYRTETIRTWNINTIVEEHFTGTPDVFSLDTEGLDYRILCDLDFEKYPIRIIICEETSDTKEKMEKLMRSRGYMLFASTLENQLWCRS